MSTEIIIAIISAVVATAAALLGLNGQIRTTRLEHKLVQQREAKLQAELRAEKAEALVKKYRDPLLKSAFDFQSRLFSIVELGFLRIYYHRSDSDREYAIKNTLYVIAEFLGWVEILRREVRFLDLGDVETNRKLEELLSNTTEVFLTDGMNLTFRLFRGEQRAIGEIMISESGSSDDKHMECIGFAEFVKRLRRPDFSQWFGKLEDGIKILATGPTERGHEQRLIALQHTLIDLIDFLDPECIRIPERHRSKVSSVRQV